MCVCVCVGGGGGGGVICQLYNRMMKPEKFKANWII